MLRQIRHSVFETNSSSTHSLTYRHPLYRCFSDYLYEHGRLGYIKIGEFRDTSESEEMILLLLVMEKFLMLEAKRQKV